MPVPGDDLAQRCETSQLYRQMSTPLFAPSPKEHSPVCDCIWALFTRATEEKFSYKPILTYISVTSVECLLKGLSVEEAFYLLSRKRFVTVITNVLILVLCSFKMENVTLDMHLQLNIFWIKSSMFNFFVKGHFTSGSTHWSKRSSTRQGASESDLFIIFISTIT